MGESIRGEESTLTCTRSWLMTALSLLFPFFTPSVDKAVISWLAVDGSCIRMGGQTCSIPHDTPLQWG